MTEHSRRKLAARLRELRESGLGVTLTQSSLAAAMSEQRPLSGAAISMWESAGSNKRPSKERVVQYALLFSSTDNLSPSPTVPAEADLDQQARARFTALRRELFQLREDASSEARAERSTAPPPLRANEMWQHDRTAEVFIVASELNDDERPARANAGNANYSRLARYGHLDAFFETYSRLASAGYQRLRHRSANERGIDTTRHLVLIGGPTWNRVTRSCLRRLDMPVHQEIVDGNRPEVFTMPDGALDGPTVIENEVVTDLGLFVRATNPTNPDTDVTICSGGYASGVLGAVRAFTNPKVAPDNVDVIRSAVGQITNFFALFRVPVVYGRVSAKPRLDGETLIECGVLGPDVAAFTGPDARGRAPARPAAPAAAR